MTDDIILTCTPTGNDGTVNLIVSAGDKELAVEQLDIMQVAERERVADRLLREFTGMNETDLRDQLTRMAAGVAKGRNDRARAWEPLIQFGHFDLPEFPLEAFPDRLCALCEFCGSMAESYQVPPDLPALLGLAIGGAALAKRVVVHVQGDWWEPINLFVSVAMPSGERKSGVFRAMTAPYAEFELSENERLAPEIERNAIERAMLAGALKHAQTEAARAKKPEVRRAARQRALKLAEELRTAEVLCPLHLIADDATPEALGRLLHEQGGRIALLSPEGDVFDLMAGRYSDSTPRLGVYLKGHAGDDLRVDRVSRHRPPEFVRDPALTVGLTVQPEVLRGLAQKPGFRGRGLLARFIFSLPGSRVGYRKLTPKPVSRSVANGYADLIRAALELRPRVDERGKPRPHVIQAGNEALAELSLFRGTVEKALRPGGNLEGLRDWGNKLPGAVCRIAGIFHGLIHAATNDPAAHELSAESMVCAITVGEYAVEHAKAAFFEMGADPTTGLVRQLVEWITVEKLTEFTRRDAFIQLRGTVHRVKEVDDPLRLLTEHGYIRERAIEHSGPGRKPSPVYEVNPMVHAHNTHNAQNSGSKGDFAHSVDCAQGVGS